MDAWWRGIDTVRDKEFSIEGFVFFCTVLGVVFLLSAATSSYAGVAVRESFLDSNLKLHGGCSKRHRQPAISLRHMKRPGLVFVRAGSATLMCTYIVCLLRRRRFRLPLVQLIVTRGVVHGLGVNV